MALAAKELELLVAKIQKQLAPKAEVQHNVMLDGRQSKRKRQIDVLVREKIGQYDILIIIDCKDYAKPVDVKGVEEFYGLLTDVGAQKGVLVCPKGFSQAAKTRAEGLQIDLFSPIDTDIHKWTATVSMPALCDFRSAKMAFGFSTSAPLPFRLAGNFYETEKIYDEAGNELGTMLQVAARRWDAGEFPIEAGEHKGLKIFAEDKVFMKAETGTMGAVDLTVSLHVEQQLYVGDLPITKMSGFKDELSGKIITNAFTTGVLSIEDVEKNWKEIAIESDAPVPPVIKLQGLVAWT